MWFSFTWFHLLNIWHVSVYVSQSHISVLVFNCCLKPVPNISALWTEHPEESSAESCPAPPTDGQISGVRIPMAVLCPVSGLSSLLIPARPVSTILAMAEQPAWRGICCCGHCGSTRTHDRPLLVALWVTGSTLLVQIHLEYEGCWNPINIFA